VDEASKKMKLFDIVTIKQEYYHDVFRQFFFTITSMGMKQEP
jgi:hypothetical protein